MTVGRRFEGKLAVLTGAAGGIGAATAARLAAEGAELLLCGRAAEPLEILASRLPTATTVVPIDLTTPDSAAVVVAAALEAGSRIDVLINNAAIDHTAPVLVATDEDVRRVFEINFFAAARLLQACASEMEAGASIVNVSSRLASIGVPTMGFYGASKGALNALTRGAAVELAPSGIRVNAVAPGMTRTPLYSEWVSAQDDPDAVERKVREAIPLGELANPEDVAAAIAFLASGDAGHITGVVLPVDGGYTAA
jgi:NAD(P)-dependent dehydrogenase (short-subunit alcohol dehydrogenase family)